MSLYFHFIHVTSLHCKPVWPGDFWTSQGKIYANSSLGTLVISVPVSSRIGLRSFPIHQMEEIQAILVLEKLLQSVKNHQDPDLAPQPNTTRLITKQKINRKC